MSEIPETLKTEIDKKAELVSVPISDFDTEAYWMIRVDDLNKILKKHFEKDDIVY